MKLLVAAVGKAKASPEQALFNDYVRRLPWKLDCKECVVKLSDAAQKKSKENDELLAACKGYERLVALDESGKTLSSQEFADQLKRWQTQGFSSAAFIIGGADGLEKTTLAKANLVWSFGRVTWPHMLVRSMLAEQLYRAHSLISGHPYHRG